MLGPLGNGFRLDVERPLLVGGGIGVAPFPYLSERLGRPPAVLGFRSEAHAEAAALVPNAEVVVEPRLVTEAMPAGHDVLACGPEPMLRAVADLAPGAQLAWEAPMACGYGALLRLRRRDRRGAQAPLRRRARPGASRMILNASGCLDALTAPEVAQSLDAFVTKTVTPLPREGNQPVRIAETDLGMLNSIGLANPGIDGFLADTLAAPPRSWGIRCGYLSAGSQRGSTPTSARGSTSEPVAAIELNVSCPNVSSPEEEVEEIVAAARAATTKTLYAKLSPAVPDVGAAAAAAARAGADGLTLVNTIRGLALDERTLEPKLGPGVGGLSGPALRPIALAAVFTAYRATGLPIVGVGGVETGAHGLELIAAGASAFALGTVLFADPEAPVRVREELEREASARGFATPLAAYAAAHGGPPPTPLRRVA